MATKKAIGNVAVVYGGDTLTTYLNTASMEAIVNAIDTTNLGSTAMESIPGPAGWTVNVGGFWDTTLDGYLGPDAVTPPTTLNDLVVTIDTIAYTWTANSFLGNYTIDATDVSGAITWSGTLEASGPPGRA
jgi:hypothetical protein